MPSNKRRQIFIEPPRLKFDFIRDQAEVFRKKYVNPENQIPVPIEEIVEISLGLQIIPISGLQAKTDIDGFLTKDMKSICIDSDLYMDDRRLSRLRFTLAHEVGHFVLHKNEIQQCDSRTPEDWMRFREDFREDDLNWFESQAYEFAGRLLVPRDQLREQIMAFETEIKSFKKHYPEKPDLIEAIARIICGKFGVSHQVIQKRLEKEKIHI